MTIEEFLELKKGDFIYVNSPETEELRRIDTIYQIDTPFRIYKDHEGSVEFLEGKYLRVSIGVENDPDNTKKYKIGQVYEVHITPHLIAHTIKL